MGDKKRFRNKVVVITGASAGIGRATAIAFANEEASVAIISRNEGRLLSLKNELEEKGTRTFSIPLDVGDAKAVEQAVIEIESGFGEIDVWVNNAMLSVFSPVKEMTVEEYERVTSVTYLGYVYATLSVLKKMLSRNRGVIVQVGSALAYRGIPLQSAYCAAKHAVKGFHESLITELLHDGSGVKVTMVQLPAHNTPQFEWVRSRLKHKAQPVPPIFQPEVAARAIVHAALHPKREWIVAWPAFKAVWGNKFFPAYADRYLARTGYESQQTSEQKDPLQPDNLFQSVNGTFGSHGRFNEQAKTKSVFFWLTLHRQILVFVMALLILVVLFIMIYHDR